MSEEGRIGCESQANQERRVISKRPELHLMFCCPLVIIEHHSDFCAEPREVEVGMKFETKACKRRAKGLSHKSTE